MKVKTADIKAYKREYYLNNKDRYNSYSHKCDRTPKRRFDRAKNRSKAIWNISYEDWLKLVSQSCDYCGESLPETGYGLDRKDPTGDYTLNNVVPCCAECNKTKRNRFSYEEFKVMMNAYLDYKNGRVKL